jgi:hypothetical protein
VRERKGVEAGEPGEYRGADRKLTGPPQHLRIIRARGASG